MADESVSVAALAEERLKLEREAFEIERERLQSARDRAEAELKVARSRHPLLVFVSVALLALVSFAGGILLGISVNENRHQSLRDARLKEALSQLSGSTESSSTNRVLFNVGSKLEPGKGVSVVVFQ